MGIPLRVLIVEDSEDDALFVIRELQNGGYETAFERVETAAAMRDAFSKKSWDLILCDYNLPRFSGLDALALYRELGIDAPFIVVSGTIGEEVAVHTMKAGAADYVLKDNLTRLVPAVERELKEAVIRRERRQAEEQLQKSKQDWETTFQAIGHPTIILSPERMVIAANRAVFKITGLTEAQVLGKPCYEVFHPGKQAAPAGCPMKTLLASSEAESSEMDIEALGGIFHVHCTPIVDETGALQKIIHVMTDITERKRIEDTLREKQKNLEDAHRLAHLGIWSWDRDSNVLTWSEEVYEMVGLDPRQPPPGIEEHKRLYSPGDWDKRRAANKRALTTGETYQLEQEICRADGTRRWIDSLGGPKHDAAGRIIGLQGTVQDITDRKRAEERQHKEGEWKNLLFWLYDEASNLPEQGIYDYILERIVELTDSEIGFFHLVEDDQKTIVLTSWNQEARKTCQAAYDYHYPIEQAGNWVDCVRTKEPVIYNDFPHSPNQKGLPEGHTPLRRFMSIPILEGDHVRAIFGVGNKREAYNEYDVIQIKLMSNDLHKIFQQRRAEDALRESERRYREMVDLLPVTVFEADTNGMITSLNPAARQTFKLTDEDLTKGLKIFRAISGRERERAGAHFADVIGGKKPQLREYELVRADGETFPAMILSSSIFRGDTIIGLRGVVIDLSEIKAAQESLRLSEEKYRSIYDNATEGIFQSTPEGRLLSANRALAWMNGYETPEELIANTKDIARQLYVNSEKRQVMVKRMTEQGFANDFEFQIYRKGGSKIWVSMNAHVVKNEKGDILYYEGTMTDISRRKEAEEQLRQAYAVLQEVNEKLVQADKLAAVGTLAAGVAHEILNPLNIISTGIAALKATEDLSLQVQEAFDIFQRQVDRVVRIARDLQQFSRKSATHMESANLLEVIESTLTLCAPRFKVEKITPLVDFDDTIPRMTLDRNRMGQVFLNLINNALDAMAGKEKKDLRIAARVVSGHGISLPRVLVAVSDQGQGIAPAALGQLFDPFFTTKEPGKGTGLGLSISHTIVQNHGGRIWAENNPDEGATFFVELPLEGGQSL